MKTIIIVPVSGVVSVWDLLSFLGGTHIFYSFVWITNPYPNPHQPENLEHSLKATPLLHHHGVAGFRVCLGGIVPVTNTLKAKKKKKNLAQMFARITIVWNWGVQCPGPRLICLWVGCGKYPFDITFLERNRFVRGRLQIMIQFLQILLIWWMIGLGYKSENIQQSWARERSNYIHSTFHNYNQVLIRGLKTLFNIVEASFKKLLNIDVCVVWWCSDGPINSQEYKSFDIYCVHYQDIYDSISPLNKWSGILFIPTQLLQSIGINEQDKCGHLSIFTSLKH